MEQVGSQVKLPFSRAFGISVQGIRIRLGRSLVTVSGVVLGIAFLMSNLTGQLIKNAVAAQREIRQQANLMMTMVKSEVGDIEGKAIAVAVFGATTAPERQLVQSLVALKPASFRGSGIEATGVTPADANKVADGAALLIILGDAKSVPTGIGDLTQGMSQKLILDAVTERSFSGQDDSVRRECFFGAQLDQQKARMEKEARQNRARTLWIVIISLLVTVIGVSNALLMSVTERFREIGTMKCLGALSSFIRRLFLIESLLIGCAGSALGAVVGALLTMVAYGFTYSFALVLGSMPYGWLALAGIGSTVVGTALAVVAAIYPAGFASRMVPASALRSTV